LAWSRTYGGSGYELAYGVDRALDGGYFVAGWTDGWGEGGRDLWVVKTDAAGVVVSDRTYGRAGDDYAWKVRRTLDGGCVLAGAIRPDGSSASRFWVLKLDAELNEEWQRTFDGDWLWATAILQADDGGYVVAGPRNNSFWVVKLNAVGTVQWQKTYGESNGWPMSIAATADGGYVLAGYTSLFGAGNRDAWVVKLDASGGLEWQTAYGGSANDEAQAIAPTVDGGYIIAGTTYSFGSGLSDIWVIKMDGDGQPVWSRALGGPGQDFGFAVAPAPDGGAVVVGRHQPEVPQPSKVWALKLDSMGGLQWQKAYGEGAVFIDGRAIRATASGGFVIAGWTEGLGAGQTDFWLLKTDTEGEIDPSCTFVSDTTVVPVDTTPLATVTNTDATEADTAEIAWPADALAGETTVEVYEQCASP